MSELDLTTPNWNNIPATCIIGYARMKHNDVLIETDGGMLIINLLAKGFRLRSAEKQDYDYGIFCQSPESVSCNIEQDDNTITLTSEHQKLVLQKTPFSFQWWEDGNLKQRTPNDGHFVRQYRIPPLAKCDKGWLLSLDLEHDEAVYGLGEKWSGLNKRGQFLRSYNVDALGVNGEVSYKNTPFAWSPNGWGCFVHTPAPVTHAVGHGPWSQRAYAILVEDEQLDIVLFAGSTGAQIIDTYTDWTGKSPVPPLWSLGVILSKAYYRDVPELLETASAVRDHNMPCDVITLDGRAWQDTDTRFAFEWDPKRFDDPAAVINQLKAQNFKVCVWEYPLVSVSNPLFDKMAEKGWLLKDKRTGDTYRYQWDMSAFGEVLTPLPESGIVDFTHPDAFEFWLKSHKPLFDLGVDMIKADFGEQVEDDNMLAYSGDTGDRLHNVYSLLYNRCVYMAAKKYAKNGPFLFSRSAWAGSQQYPSQWGGDPQADWGGLAASVRGALSWGMSGAPYFATDVGGFYKDTRDAELFVRWSQAAVFSAHMRLHGIGQREPWSYGNDAEEAVNQALDLRYQLIPYLQIAMQQASETGLPVMRSMALAFPNEKLSWQFEHQFMFGAHMLVAPCLVPGGRVSVYLPKGQWRRFPTGERVEGGQLLELILTLDEMAVFVPDGISIGLGPKVEHTEQLSPDTQLQQWPTN